MIPANAALSAVPLTALSTRVSQTSRAWHVVRASSYPPLLILDLISSSEGRKKNKTKKQRSALKDD